MCEWAPRYSAVGFCGHPILQMRKLRLKEVRELTKMAQPGLLDARL